MTYLCDHCSSDDVLVIGRTKYNPNQELECVVDDSVIEFCNSCNRETTLSNFTKTNFYDVTIISQEDHQC